MSLNFLTELCNKCLKESCFSDHCKISLVVHVFKNIWERSTAEGYHPASLLSAVSKVFEKLVYNRIDHLKTGDLFSNYQCGFRSWSTAYLLTVVSDRTTRAFNRSGATQVVAVWGFWENLAFWSSSQLTSYGILSQIFGLIPSFLSNNTFEWF